MTLTEENKYWFGEQMGHLDAKIERVETSLLTAFHQWAGPVEMRLRSTPRHCVPWISRWKRSLIAF